MKNEAINKGLGNIKDSIENGLPANFMNDRINKLENYKRQMETELLSLNKPTREEVNLLDLEIKAKELLNEFDSSFDAAPINRKKELIEAFVDRIDISQSERRATCYINKMPEIVKVYTCRRSESNIICIMS